MECIQYSTLLSTIMDVMSSDVPDVPTLSSVKPKSKECLKDADITPILQCFHHGDKSEISRSLVPVMPGAYFIDNVLAEDECNRLIEYVNQSSTLSFWSEKGRADAAARAFRNADTIEFDSAGIAEIIWNRIKDLVSTIPELSYIVIPDNEYDESTGKYSDDRWQVDICGVWQATGMNNDMLLARYPSFGSFAPHTDGNAVHNFNQRSFISAVIYLNSIPPGCGGGTKFYTREACDNLFIDPNSSSQQWTASASHLLAEVHPVMGRVLLFDQQLVHEGVPPTDPYEKFIIRSDTIFTRTPAICVEPEDAEAFKLYRQAEVVSEEGDTDAAIRLFKKAFRISPAFAKIMKQT